MRAYIMHNIIPNIRLLKVIQWLLITVWLLINNSLSANSLTTEDVLTATITNAEKNSSEPEQLNSIGYQSSSWLMAFPTVSINYLDSQDVEGNDEQAISLNLPLKSPFYAAKAKRLSKLNQESTLLRLKRKKLYFSGIIREALWNHRLAEVELNQATKKQQLLEKLLKESQELFNASEIEQYALLLIEQEIATQDLSISSLEQKLLQWKNLYINITGLQHFPESIEENLIVKGDFILANHPEVQFLVNQRHQQQLLLDIKSNGDAEPWVLSFESKTINNGLFEESQLGINVEIPLTFSSINQQSDINTKTNINSEYYTKLDSMRVDLYSRWAALKSKQRNIKKQQLLLQRSAEISNKISHQLAGLHNNGEISHEIWLRRNLQTIDNQTAVALGIVNNQQIQSMLNQAAGISL